MRLILILGFMLFAAPAQAQGAIETYQFKTPQMEADYTKLINELRCLVCQNQNLASSNADLAKDLREQTYDMLLQGNSADQVVEYMVARYGDFVLYRPQFKLNTLLLWLGPFVLLLLVLFLVFRNFRRQQKLTLPDASALQRAQQLLADDVDKK